MGKTARVWSPNRVRRESQLARSGRGSFLRLVGLQYCLKYNESGPVFVPAEIQLMPVERENVFVR